MFKDDTCDLGRVARKITGLRAFTKIHITTDRRFKADPQGARWALVRDWAADCWNQLNKLMAGFYPKRLVRRLRRTLRYVDGVVSRVLPVRQEIPAEFKPGSHVVRRQDEASIFAQLMAMPREKGQLLC